jgi:hypothetical protein
LLPTGGVERDEAELLSEYSRAVGPIDRPEAEDEEYIAAWPRASLDIKLEMDDSETRWVLPWWRWLDIPGSAGERKRGCREAGDLGRMVMSYRDIIKEDEQSPLRPAVASSALS